MKTMVLFCIYLCGLYANNLDMVDSKGRSFWDKRFVVYDTGESRSIIAYTPMERIVLEIQDSKDNIILQGDEFIFLFTDAMKHNPQDKYSLKFLDDNSIQWCMFGECEKYVLCPK